MSRDACIELARRAGVDPDELVEWWEERASVREYDGGQARPEAESDALEDMRAMIEVGPRRSRPTRVASRSESRPYAIARQSPCRRTRRVDLISVGQRSSGNASHIGMLRVAIVVSVAVHVVLIAIASVSAVVLDDEARASAAPVTITIEPPPLPLEAPPPVEIQLFALPPGTQVAALDPATLAGPAKPRGERRVASADKPATATATGEPAIAKPKPALYTMRNAKNTRLEISGSFMDKILENTKPLPPIPDLPGARIDAQIAEAIEAKRHCHTDCAGTYAAIAELRAQRRNVELKSDNHGGYTAEKSTYVAKVDPDGKIHIHDKPNIQREGIGLRFDVNDALMRKFGSDPYASAKLKMMDRTRDQRVAIGKEYKREVLSHSGEYMRKNINWLWGMTGDLAKRKQGLFDLWDECAETGSEELVNGGIDARRVLVAWVQLKLVGKQAYTAAELARLNAHRRSKMVFAPYEVPRPTPPVPVQIPED
jgi:hypothetical protein